jgi:FixJ family two-component response regulator
MNTAQHVVAVVDDDENVRRALCRLIKSLSYRPLDYESGDAFLAAVGGGDLVCALIDLHMPHTNGIDVLKRMKTEGHATPVVIITGMDEVKSRQACMASGAFDYLVKPIDRLLLGAVLKSSEKPRG